MKTVTEMAREAGIRDWTCNGTYGCLERLVELVRADLMAEKIDPLIALARADEREACAKVCEENATDLSEGDWDSACINCADHIRARSNT